MNDTPSMSPIHPGEVLLQEYLEPFGVTQHKLAVAIGVPPRRINEIVHGKRRISADSALRLGGFSETASETRRVDLQALQTASSPAVLPETDRVRPGSPGLAVIHGSFTWCEHAT